MQRTSPYKLVRFQRSKRSELKAKFEKEGFQSNIFTIVSNGKKLYKVWVGEYQTYEEARRFTAEN